MPESRAATTQRVPDLLGSLARSVRAARATHGAPGTGPFYAYDESTLDRAEAHGCLDEDVETGDPIVCALCAYPAGEPPRLRRTPGDRD